jgi:hypothetical protein
MRWLKDYTIRKGHPVLLWGKEGSTNESSGKFLFVSQGVPTEIKFVKLFCVWHLLLPCVCLSGTVPEREG